MDLGENNKSKGKIEKVLKKFLDPDFQVKNDVYLNLFLTHLVGKNVNCEEKSTLKPINPQLKDQFCDWLIRATELWEKKKVRPPATILSFTLNLASHLCTEEQTFVKLNGGNVFETLIGLAQRTFIQNASVTLGFVTLLCSFLEHKCGVQWTLATDHWMTVLSLGIKVHTMYIRKKAHHFVIKLLEKSVSVNRNFGQNLVSLLVKPLKDLLQSLSISKENPHANIQNKDLFDSLKPSLQFMSEVLKVLLEQFNQNAIELFIEQNTSEAIEQILLLSQSEDFTYELLKVQFVFLFYRMCVKVEGKQVVAHDSPTLSDIKILFELIKREIYKNNCKCVIKISDYAHELFCSLNIQLPQCVRNGETLKFQNQMLLFEIIPVWFSDITQNTVDSSDVPHAKNVGSEDNILQHLATLHERRATAIFLEVYSTRIARENHIPDEMMEDDFRRYFGQKLLKMSAMYTIDLGVRWREQLLSKPHLLDDVIFGLRYISKTKKLLNKERAATLFPALVHSLQDFLTILEKTPHFPDLIFRHVQYLTTLVDTAIDLVESFNLTWKETIETIRVMDLACDFLNYPSWNNKLIVIKGLKLLNTAITRYMSPDMVLLIYNTENSKVAQTGSLLYVKCHDSSWEIRDSALEVIHTLALNANSKFPALTSVLLNAELPQLIVQMALKDGESYVRATAFQCLQELIQIQDIWDVVYTHNSFLDNILGVFENETEGIVRKEATKLIHLINKHHQFPDEMLPRLYDVMTHAAIGDLHWEVKFNAMHFWVNSLANHLTNQGMIDKSFPSHTFSKELKKIVVLNETEIKKRIIKVLNQLAHTGCLYVLKCAAQDDCDIEVSKEATKFCLKILELLRTYKVSSENVDFCEPPSPTQQPKKGQQSLFAGPVTPASNSTWTASSPSLGSTEATGIQYYDPFSPLTTFMNQPADLNLESIDPIATHAAKQRNTQSPDNGGANVIAVQQILPSSDSLQVDPSRLKPFMDMLDPPDFNQESSVSINSHSVEQSNPECPDDVVASRNDMVQQMLPSLDSQQVDPSRLKPIIDMFDVDMFGVEKGNASGIVDLAQREKAIEDFLNSNDLTLLQQIYSPNNEITKSTIQMKKRTYLAPSQFMQFIYNEVGAHVVQKTQWLNKMDEFDSLLDDILKQYDLSSDINNMDCY